MPFVLDCVALFGHTEIVTALLAAGADKTIKNSDGNTALNYADEEEIKALLR